MQGLVAVLVSMLSVFLQGRAWVRDHPAPPDPPPAVQECDQWCQGVGAARAAEAAGDIAGVITAMAGAYRVPELAGWGIDTASCESGLNPQAWSGWYEGLFQHDPGYWPGRAEAAGWGGADPFDPVANAGVTMWMRSAGYSALHWPVCGR